MSSPEKSNLFQQLWRISCLVMYTILVIRVSNRYFQRKSQPSVVMQDATTIPSVLICMDNDVNKSIVNSVGSVTFHHNEKFINQSLEFMTIGRFECLATSVEKLPEANRLLVKFTHRLDGLVNIFSYNDKASQLMSAIPLVVIREKSMFDLRKITFKLSSIQATRLRMSSNDMCRNYGDGQTQRSCFDKCMRKNFLSNLTTLGSWCYDNFCRWPNCTTDYVYLYQRPTLRSSRHQLYQFETTLNSLILDFQLSMTFELYFLSMVAITAITISFCVMSSSHLVIRIIKYTFKSRTSVDRHKRKRRFLKKFCRLTITVGCVLMTIRESFNVIQH